MSVTVGSSWRNGTGGFSYQALRVHIHPRYIHVRDPFFIANDIAVISTARIVYGTRVRPININFQTVPPASEVMAIGWGATTNVPEVSLFNIIQKIFLFFIGFSR